ncbi:hypothetical protein [Pseudodesulfovibrio sp.]|uniref:nucleoside-diphosphate sugar epimerase/dehydratase n=1 Tax=Pseudodesulfovibrio sp. TaxID=2035812 RepID=UPI00261A9805|nr:hypothetical protein [Pseudodesulfovibrio sp.]MDD3312402.1 hypothetical protein [Pseudodesulfovibrio sp.]
MPIHRSEVGLLFKLAGEMRRAESVMTFGTQSVLAPFGEVAQMFFRRGLTPSALDADALRRYERAPGTLDCIALFRMFGFSDVVCADLLPFHDETYVHDLSTPLPGDMLGRFDLVWDGFTGYHVCNPMEVLLNAAGAVREGGRVVHTLLMNLVNVGFFRINPRFFARFYEENGFEDMAVYILRQGYESMVYKYEGNLHDFLCWENGNTEDILLFTARKARTVPPSTRFLEMPYEVLSRAHARRPEDILGELRGKRVAIWGTGGNYVDNFREPLASGDPGFEFVGFVDNDPARCGGTLDGHPVHPVARLGEGDVDAVIIASSFLNDIFAQMCRQFPHRMEMLQNTWGLYRHHFEHVAYKRRTVQFRVKNNMVFNKLM